MLNSTIKSIFNSPKKYIEGTSLRETIPFFTWYKIFTFLFNLRLFSRVSCSALMSERLGARVWMFSRKRLSWKIAYIDHVRLCLLQNLICTKRQKRGKIRWKQRCLLFILARGKKKDLRGDVWPNVYICLKSGFSQHRKTKSTQLLRFETRVEWKKNKREKRPDNEVFLGRHERVSWAQLWECMRKILFEEIYMRGGWDQLPFESDTMISLTLVVVLKGFSNVSTTFKFE